MIPLDDIFSLDGKTVLVIGGRGYLGRRFCTVLEDAGAKVVAADLPQISIAAAKDSTENSVSDTVMQRDVDVTDPASVENLVKEVVSETGTIDVLIYAATAKPKDFSAPFTECSLEGWKTTLDTELDGAFLVTQQVGKVMEKQKSGSILFLSSIYGLVGNDQSIYQNSNLASLYADNDDNGGNIFSHGVYNTAKGGIISFTRFLAAYWGHLGIRVNTLSPGGMAHPGENEDFIRKYSARTPLGRKANPEELDGAILFLASDASSYATGSNIVIDGGWTTW